MSLEVKGLGKRYGREWVLSDIDWRPESGSISALIGLNGAGKTTLMNILAGLYVGSRGEVLLEGEPLRRHRVDLRKRIFFIPDFPVVCTDWTLYRHVASLAVLYECDPAPIRDAFEGLIEEMDLTDTIRKPFAQMSRGQLYKAALITMKLIDAPIWLLDEPFASGMDSHGTRVMKQWFRGAVEEGKTIVFTTQLPEIAVFADQVVLLHRQHAQFFRTRGKDVLDDQGHPFDLEQRMEESRCGS